MGDCLRSPQLPVVLEVVQPVRHPLTPKRYSTLKSAPSWAPILSAFLGPSLQCFTRAPCRPPEQSISWGARKNTGFCTPLRPIHQDRGGEGRQGSVPSISMPECPHAQGGWDLLSRNVLSFGNSERGRPPETPLFPERLLSVQMALPLSLWSPHCCLLFGVCCGLDRALWWVQSTKGYNRHGP